MISLASLVETAPRISRRIVPALKKLGIKTIRDLLFHFPARYEDFSNVKNICDVNVDEVVTVRGKVVKVANRRTQRKRMFLTEATINDGSGIIKALWFNQPFMMRNLRAGQIINLAGKVALGPNGAYLQNPAHEKIQNSQRIHTGGLVAVYPETRGITSRWLRFLVKNFIELRQNLIDPLPPETLRKYSLPDLKEAIFSIHFPRNIMEAERARRRFNFGELFLIQLRALRERLKLKEQLAPEIPFDISVIKMFVGSLPFEITTAQRRSMWEIFQDIKKPRPMNRLLEGDVGSGKTVVAAAAALLAVKAGYRAAFMAPTEILARQHYETLSEVLESFRAKIGLLIGAEKLVSPETEIVVGTHALIQDNVRIENLGLVVVDEQHRFGVAQRAALIKSNEGRMVPHFLSMSATPIPRTLALTVYGDLDLSILDEMPKSRLPVITKIVEPGKRQEAYQFIREEVRRGRQVFVICPRIEIPNHKFPASAGAKTLVDKSADRQILNSERFPEKLITLTEVKAVKEEYRKLKEEIFKDLRVGMLHGKMKSKEKEAVMRRFKNKEIDILVSTSVVEVGVDVPNATVMMIEGAELFGLATLHQFRGRVGRGAEESFCFLFPSEDGLVTRRLRAMVESQNGFELAEKDLEIRGPGDIFGTQQWGVPSEILKALTDAKLVRDVRNEAVEILKKDPELKSRPALRIRLEELEGKIHPE